MGEEVAATPKTSRARREAALARPNEELLTVAERDAVLAYGREHRDCNLTELGQATGVRRYLVRALLDRDPEFREQWMEARGYGPERIRSAMAERAIDGVPRPVFQGGKKIGETIEYSDHLLALMARANLPEYAVADHSTTNLDIDVKIDKREVNFAGAFEVLARAGALEAAGFGDVVPPAREIQPAPPERAAAGVPAPEEP